MARDDRNATARAKWEAREAVLRTLPLPLPLSPTPTPNPSPSPTPNPNPNQAREAMLAAERAAAAALLSHYEP